MSRIKLTSNTPACCISPFDSVPWFRLSIGILISAQSMSLGMAINISPPEDSATRLMFHIGMLAGAVLMLILLGWPLLLESLRELKAKRITMELLFLAGIAASLGISIQSMIRASGPIYFDVVSLLLVVYSVGKSIGGSSRSKAISAMRSLSLPISSARLDGRMVEAAQVKAGDCVTVMPGEIIPVDGRIVQGRSFVRNTPFTGQSTSLAMETGEDVLAGSACEDGTLLIEATRSGSDRRIDKLGQLIDSARCLPSDLQRQADRLVRWFLPVVIFVGVGTYIYWSPRVGSGTALMHALAVLLVACPCAAGLATPLSLWVAMGRLSQRGLVLHSGEAVERLAQVRHAVFDKTGTLCAEELELDRFEADDDSVAAIVAAVEAHSTHPVARALTGLKVDRLVSVEVKSEEILPGRGIEALVQVNGCPRMIRLQRRDCGTDFQPVTHGLETQATSDQIVIDIFLDDQLAGSAFLRERLRDSARDAIGRLEQQGIDVRVMTGDAGSSLSIPSQVKLTPDEKHRLVLATPGTLFVGDGVNDAAAMAAAHASIALAGGADIAVQTAQATLHGGDLTLVPLAIDISRSAVATIRSNLRLAVVYNLVGIILAATGLLHPILAAVLMAVSSAVVSWRAFHLDRFTLVAASGETRFQKSFYIKLAAIHVAGIVIQLFLFTRIAGLGAVGTILITISAILVAPIMVRLANRLPEWIDHLLAMFTLGGLGMNLGWWADLGFTSAVHGSMVHSCCSPEGRLTVLSWMNLGMLLLGTPAMYWLRRTGQPFSWKKWCCVGPLVIGCPAMVGGMLLGSMLAMRLGLTHPLLRVGSDYLLMMAGMLAGMLIPHLIEVPFKRTPSLIPHENPGA